LRRRGERRSAAVLLDRGALRPDVPCPRVETLTGLLDLI